MNTRNLNLVMTIESRSLMKGGAGVMVGLWVYFFDFFLISVLVIEYVYHY